MMRKALVGSFVLLILIPLCLFDASLLLPLGPLTYGHEFHDFATSSVPIHPHFCYLVLVTRSPPTLSSRQNPTALAPHHIHTSALTPNILPTPSFEFHFHCIFSPLRLLCTTSCSFHGLHSYCHPTQPKPLSYRILLP